MTMPSKQPNKPHDDENCHVPFCSVCLARIKQLGNVAKDMRATIPNKPVVTPQTYQERLAEILESSLKKAIAYGFDKGYANDHKPDHTKANAIRDEAQAAINALNAGVLDDYAKIPTDASDPVMPIVVDMVDTMHDDLRKRFGIEEDS
jgi:hypothetical protein